MRDARKRTDRGRRGRRMSREGSVVSVGARTVVVGGAIRCVSLSQDAALLPNVAFGHFLSKLFAVPDTPFGKEVVLDPDNLVDCAEESGFALEGETGMRYEGFGEDILDVAEAGADVDVFDVELV